MGPTNTRDDTPIDHWLRQSLAERYGATLRETLSDELMALLGGFPDR